ELEEPQPFRSPERQSEVTENLSATSPEPEPTQEERLLDALRDELRRIRSPKSDLLSNAHIERISIDLTNRSRAVTCSREGTTLHRRHPVVQGTLEVFDRDPIAVSFLASLVFTSLNDYYKEISDEDERRFQQQLINHILTGLS
ncbi:hypothetical protein MYX75_03535, partial [Acidobacteria bacterium AH-259-A15]|nr:hypothetical protein [Acidobacteria bacterium AH-259-A15]